LRSSRPRSVRYSAAYLAVLVLAILLFAILVPSPTPSPPPPHTDEVKTQSVDASNVEGAACARPGHLELDPQTGDLVCIKPQFNPPQQANASLP
jgi:hypothetical protein